MSLTKKKPYRIQGPESLIDTTIHTLFIILLFILYCLYYCIVIYCNKFLRILLKQTSVFSFNTGQSGMLQGFMRYVF